MILVAPTLEIVMEPDAVGGRLGVSEQGLSEQGLSLEHPPSLEQSLASVEQVGMSPHPLSFEHPPSVEQSDVSAGQPIAYALAARLPDADKSASMIDSGTRL